MISSLFPGESESVVWRVGWHGTMMIALIQLICCLFPTMPGRVRVWLWRLAIIKLIVVAVWRTPIELPVLPPSPVKVAAAESPPVMFVGPTATAHVVSGWATGLYLCWALGTGCFTYRIWNAHRTSTRFRRECRPISDSLLISEVAACARSLRLKAVPRLLEYPGFGSPLVIGLLHPAIVLPSQTWLRLASAERQMAFRHELAHLKHNDLAWNLIAALVRSIFFFHPLVWWAERELRTAHEMAADELVVRSQAGDSLGYGALLVSIVRQTGAADVHPSMAVGAAGSIGMLTRRLAAMRFMNSASRRGVYASAVCAALIAVAGIIPWRLIPSKTDHAAGAASSASGGREAGRRTTAEIRITRRSNQHDSLLAEPIVEFSGDSQMTLPIDNDHSIKVAVETNWQDSPMIHSVSVVFIENPQTESPKLLFAPRVTLSDGSNAMVQDLDENGDGLKIEVAVTAKPSNS